MRSGFTEYAQPGHLAFGKWNLGRCIVWELKASSLYSILAVMLSIIRNVTLLTVLPIELYCWKAFLSLLHSFQNFSHILNQRSFTSGWSLAGLEDSTFSRQLTLQDNHFGLTVLPWQAVWCQLGCLGAMALPLVYKRQLFGRNDPLVLPSTKISPCDCQDLSRQRHLHTVWVPWVLCWGWWVNGFVSLLWFLWDLLFYYWDVRQRLIISWCLGALVAQALYIGGD